MTQAPYSELPQNADVLVGLRTVAPVLAIVLLALLALVALVIAFRRPLARAFRAVSPHGAAADGVVRVAVLAALQVVGTFALVELLTGVGFFADLGVGRMVLPLGAAACFAGVVAAARKTLAPGTAARASAVVLGGLIVVTVGFAALAGSVYDASWDGNWYHQPAVVTIAQGWNPVADPAGDTLATPEWDPFYGPDEDIAVLVVHYPKGGWVRQAAFYQLAGRLEQAKALNLLLIGASFVIWLGALVALRPGRWVGAAAAAALIALNPIAVVQAFTFLNDGQMASLLAIAAAFGVLLFTRYGGWPVLAGLASALALPGGLKFTGLVYVVFGAVALSAFVWRSRSLVLPKRPALGALWAAIALSVLVSSFNPYVINTAEYRSPFHPIIGPEAPEVEWVGAPDDFRDMGALEKLGRSIFSRAADESVRGRGLSELKIPFTVSRDEIRPYLSFVTRIAGFGPWFGGAVLLALALGFACARDRAMRGSAAFWLLSGVVTVSIVTSVVNPESWWARYVPQLWLAPVAIGALGALLGRTRPQRGLAWALLGALALNAGFVAAVNGANVVQADREIGAAIETIDTWDTDVVLDQGDFGTTWVKLEEREIAWRLVDEHPDDAAAVTVPYTTTTAYPDE